MNKKYWTLGLIAVVLIVIIGFFAWDSAENTTAFTIQGYSGDVIGYGNFFLKAGSFILKNMAWYRLTGSP